jgi:hypothetical protein
MLVQRLAGDAGLDHAIQILCMNFKNPVHVAQIDADAAGRRVDLALQRGAGAEGDHGNRVFGADPHLRPGYRRFPAPSPPQSGGCVGSQVVVWACCSRTAKEVISRLPNRAASASTALASACGSGRFTLPDIVVATPNSSRI